MNWVGGSRSRYLKNKEDTIKQRAFFQKQRMKSKSNYMDLPKGQNPGNMDLLTLFIVNQIASKKAQQSVQSNTGKPKINQMISAKRTKKALNEPLEFPMSPCPPSNLNLVTSQPKYSVDAPGFKARKYRLSEEFKFKQLSPVPESNLSDNSGSEYQEQPSQASNVPSDPVEPKPTPHLPSSSPSREGPDSMKDTPQLIKLVNPWPDVSNEALMEDVPHNHPGVGIQFEETSLNQEMGEHSATSVLYPLSPLKSSKQPEEPHFIDFTNMDCEVLSSLNSSDRSQNIHNDVQFLKQTGAQRHDGNPSIISDAGTQTEAVTYHDVSVQCSPIHRSDSKSLPAAPQESSILTRRPRSFHLNQFLELTTLSSLKDGHKRTGNSSSGASATNQQSQRRPKSKTSLSSCKRRSPKGMKRHVTSVLKHSLPKASEQIKQQQWECRVKLERCDGLRLENVRRNPVKDVRRAGEPRKK